jgi:hypothetical protein
MRYRSISRILISITVVLALFILYQAWLKPALFPPPAPLTTMDDSAPFVSLADSDFSPETDLFPDTQQTRLVTPVETSDAHLQLIWDQLERGQLREVERALRAFPQKKLRNIRHRQFAAALWNNLGVQQEKYGGAELSVHAFRHADALDSKNVTIELNLAQAYWARRDPAMTQDFLMHVMRLAPADPFPRLALAELLIEKSDFEVASHHLEETVPTLKHHPELDAYAQRLLALLPRTPVSPDAPPPQTVAARLPSIPMPQAPAGTTSGRAPQPRVMPVKQSPAILPKPAPPAADMTPRQFRGRAAERFTVRFDGHEDQETWIRLRAILEYAHQDISLKFGYAPSAPIAVVLHTEQPFNDTSSTPAWADTLFETTGGVIHVPGQGALDDLGLLSRVVRHQFVHAMLHQKLGAKTAGVPHWLLEGLALHLAEDPWPGVEDAKTGAGSLVSLRTLQSGWNSLAGNKAALGYLEASSATQHLVDRYTMYEVRQLLNLIQAGHTLDSALQTRLSTSFDSFERQWTTDMVSRLKSGKS